MSQDGGISACVNSHGVFMQNGVVQFQVLSVYDFDFATRVFPQWIAVREVHPTSSRLAAIETDSFYGYRGVAEHTTVMDTFKHPQATLIVSRTEQAKPPGKESSTR